MKTKPEVIYSQRWTFITKTGKRITVIMKLRKFSKKLEYPEGLKINWIAYNEDEPNERVLFDNHHGKSLHYHIDKDKLGVPFTWTSRERVEALFWQKVRHRFGYFELE